jgi:hypothetical protein
VLLNEATRFERSLTADEAVQEAAVRDLLDAADEDAAPTTFAFQPGIGQPAPSPRFEGLASVLFDLQSANLLVAAAIERKEIEVAANAGTFHMARHEMVTTRDAVEAPAAIRFELETISSSTPDEAAREFRKWSGKLLDEIVVETAKTIEMSVDSLKKLDPLKVSEALGALVKPLPFATDVGLLMRRGIQKLRHAIEALIALFGKEAFEKIKSEIDKIRSCSGDTAHQALEAALGVRAVKERVEVILDGGRPAVMVDRASNSLTTLAGAFTDSNALLRALIRAIDLAAVLLLMLSFASPWLAVGLAVAYLSSVGGALLVAGEYTGGRQLLHWTKGVKQVAEGIVAP